MRRIENIGGFFFKVKTNMCNKIYTHNKEKSNDRDEATNANRGWYNSKSKFSELFFYQKIEKIEEENSLIEKGKRRSGIIRCIVCPNGNKQTK